MSRAHGGESAGHDVAEIAPIGLGIDGAGLDPREVEEVVHEPREPSRLLVNGG
jgi:hypothetical protein